MEQFTIQPFSRSELQKIRLFQKNKVLGFTKFFDLHWFNSWLFLASERIVNEFGHFWENKDTAAVWSFFKWRYRISSKSLSWYYFVAATFWGWHYLRTGIISFKSWQYYANWVLTNYNMQICKSNFTDPNYSNFLSQKSLTWGKIRPEGKLTIGSLVWSRDLIC